MYIFNTAMTGNQASALAVGGYGKVNVVKHTPQQESDVIVLVVCKDYEPNIYI